MGWTRRRTLTGLSAVALTGLAGCEAALAPVAPPPTLSTSNEEHYAARRDGPWTLPAVDTDRVEPWLLRQIVRYPTEEPTGSIVITSQYALLHLVMADGWALRYGISIGREGLGWTGAAEVYRRAQWPSWTPTPSMIERDPSLQRWADGQPGGPRNPLGARALYLRTLSTGADEGIRIHGTPEWRSIGRRASSGCFRMLQQDVIELYGLVGTGTRVLVT
jgi:lipoprotein-anchoring transpeptidase ErfK/SrfK